jgi:hypothetical protein
MIPVGRLLLLPATESILTGRRHKALSLPPRSKNIEYRWAYFLRTDLRVPAKNRAAISDVRDKLDQMFDWNNLLHACKDCNFEKLDADPDSPADPIHGRSLLDPTKDRPEDYLSWDLLTGAAPRSQQFR